MLETKRAIRSTAALDGVSDHLGEVLRRADDLLVEWSRFGAEVRIQVEREAHEVGRAVATAVDGAVARATATSVERGLTDQLGGKLTTLATEIGKLEQRTRAAARAIGEERRGDRRVLWAVGAGVVIANVLLVIMLLRPPVQLPQQAAPEPVRVEVPVTVPPDAAAVRAALADAAAGSAGSAGVGSETDSAQGSAPQGSAAQGSAASGSAAGSGAATRPKTGAGSAPRPPQLPPQLPKKR